MCELSVIECNWTLFYAAIFFEINAEIYFNCLVKAQYLLIFKKFMFVLISNIFFFFFIGKIKLLLSQYWQTWCSSHHKLFPCLFLSIKLLSVDIPAKFCRLQKYIFMYKLLLYWLRGIVVAAFKILTLITRHRRQLFYLFFCALMHIAAVFHVLTWWKVGFT